MEVFDVGDDKLHTVGEGGVGLGVAELVLEVVHGRLGLVEHDDTRGVVLCELAAYLAANAAGGAGNEHRLAVNLACDVGIADVDAFALEEVFDFDIFNLRCAEGAVNPEGDVRHALDFEAELESFG